MSRRGIDDVSPGWCLQVCMSSTAPFACVLGSSVATAADAAETLTQSPLDELTWLTASFVLKLAIFWPLGRLPAVHRSYTLSCRSLDDLRLTQTMKGVL